MALHAVRRLLLCAMLGAAPAAVAQAAGPLLAVIVHPATQTGALDADAVALVFKRRKLYWRDGARIQPVNLPADDALRRRFSQAVLRTAPAGLDDYWNEQYFHGVLPPHVLASEAAVLRFVAQTPQAIGYAHYCGLGADVKPVLLIDGDDRVLPVSAAPPCREMPADETVE